MSISRQGGCFTLYYTGLVDWLSAALLYIKICFCQVLACVLHYFMLASWAWMAIEAFYMYIALVKVFHTFQHKFLLKCSLVAWGKILIFYVFKSTLTKIIGGLSHQYLTPKQCYKRSVMLCIKKYRCNGLDYVNYCGVKQGMGPYS